MIFQSSMTFSENFIFPGFPDPVGTLSLLWLMATIIWTNVDQDTLQHVASLGRNELTQWGSVMHW